jgi:hypothetical protein
MGVRVCSFMQTQIQVVRYLDISISRYLDDGVPMSVSQITLSGNNYIGN